jgi:chromosome segregation ATPase
MWTGRQTLASIEDAISKLHGEQSQLDQALRSAVSETERLRSERSLSLRELARIKLDEMAAGRLVGSLDAGEQRARQILDDYRLRIAAVAEQCNALQKEVTQAEAARHAASAEVETVLDVVDHDRAEAEARVQATQAWRDAKEARDRAEAIATEAEKKAAASEAELGAKKKPYDEDPLFAYLWRRRFATSQYVGGHFARMLDRMVAEFIAYDDALPNYAALIEIPQRLKEHATAQRQAVQAPQATLAEIERHAMIEADVDAKEKVLAEARHKMAVIDDTVEKKREMLRKVDEARAALVTGDPDPAYNEALNTIASADAADSIAKLYAEARRTPTPADEAVVGRLEGIEQNIANTETEIAGLRREALELSRRRSEMEQVREQYRRTGYDHPRSTFNNDSDIANVLKGILEGAVRSGALWDILQNGHRSRPTSGNADFGSPGFPFPFPLPGGGAENEARGGAWRNPSSRGGWSPGLPGSPSDNDDFRTGGSF